MLMIKHTMTNSTFADPNHNVPMGQ